MVPTLALSLLLLGASCRKEPVTDDTGDTAPGTEVFGEIATAPNAAVAILVEVTWTQVAASDATWIEYTFEDDEWLSSPERARGAGTFTEPLLGVPAETDVTFRIHHRVGDRVVTSEEQAATTGSLPADLPLPWLEIHDPTRATPERWILASVDAGPSWYNGPFYVFLLDRQARYVWYWRMPENRTALFPQVAADGGHLLVEGSTDFVFEPGVVPGVQRMSLDLTWQTWTELPGLGFAMDEIDGGSLLYEYRASPGVRLRERRSDGTETDLWDCTAWVEARKVPASACYPNAVVWDRNRETVLWSVYNRDTVFEIDPAAGEVLWWFGGVPGGYAISPAAATPEYQHYPSWTPEGTLILSSKVGDTFGLTHLYEFEVDHDLQAVRAVWTYETEDPWAEYGGEAQRLENGNTMVSYGTGGVIQELDPDDEVVWQVAWPTAKRTHMTGHVTRIDDLYALNAASTRYAE